MCADTTSARTAEFIEKRELVVLGDGCAALSLARCADQLPDHQITLVRPHQAPVERDHVWGFWLRPGLEQDADLARASWNSWSIITADGKAVMNSETRPYMALERLTWSAECRKQAAQAGVRVIEDAPDESVSMTGDWLDSRPPSVPTGIMLQHFVGYEVKTDAAAFNPNEAILMDFRVDQSQGMHFIYLLPFSEHEALVESTLFTPSKCDDDYYRRAIDTYLRTIIGVDAYEVTRQEKGAIPLGMVSQRDPAIAGIGGNGGAIRPSSGYAFVFIQKQIHSLVASLRSGRVEVRVPHDRIDLWMDAVLLSVLRHWPAQAPRLFLAMARALNGDEFARFLGGEADWRLRAKVVMAMPKLPFIRGLLRFLAGGQGLNGAGVR